MHINSKPLCIQRNPVHRTGKVEKVHGKTGQRVAAEMAMNSHATSREWLSNPAPSNDVI